MLELDTRTDYQLSVRRDVPALAQMFQNLAHCNCFAVLKVVYE